MSLLLRSCQTSPPSLIPVCCVCSEVQDREPVNDAVPERKPSQKATLCLQQPHRERTPVHEEWMAGCAVSLSRNINLRKEIIINGEKRKAKGMLGKISQIDLKTMWCRYLIPFSLCIHILTFVFISYIFEN